jgi:IS30 family transposase
MPRDILERLNAAAREALASADTRARLRLNQRPRKTLGFETPADRLQAVLQ